MFPVPAVAFDDVNNYNHQASRHAKALKNAIWTNQFDNRANRRAHLETTGPEILKQLPALTGFVCATGTGGTLAGVTRYLKQHAPGVVCMLADPPGSVLYSLVRTGKLERTGVGSITEGNSLLVKLSKEAGKKELAKED